VNDFAPGLYKSTDYGKTWTKIVKGISASAYTRVVREDSQRKGLLYAGTETGFYISFDGGSNWRQQQFGLPITPITDLKVHQDDLIASTMGRSFWILDDIEVLRQFNDNEADRFKLFTPADVVRVSGGSTLNGVVEVDEPRAPSPSFAGTNAATGAVLYYQLGEVKDEELTLEIFNSRNELVRRFSSRPDAAHVSYPGGPSPDEELPTRKGLNRFVWDLRGESIKGVPTVFIEGSYDGYRVAPGVYAAKMTWGNQTQTTQIVVKPHPGLTFSQSEYEEQAAFIKTIVEEASLIHGEVIHARRIAAQLRETATLLQGKLDALVRKAEMLHIDLKVWEDDVVQNKAKSNDDIINFVNKITADYVFLKGEADTNVPYVTAGQKQQFQTLHAQWLALKARKERLEADVKALNTEISKAGIGRIIL
jgi:hypothetical protein